MTWGHWALNKKCAKMALGKKNFLDVCLAIDVLTVTVQFCKVPKKFEMMKRFTKIIPLYLLKN